ncbi:MAG: hypothetical protein FWF30_03060 [Coriobacteriia bacterium]|nr:hypothetical protein [Coriobacteriia bacterium]
MEKMFEEMDVAELSDVLYRTRMNLEDLEEERLFTLSQTGMHVPGGTVSRYEAEINGIRERIDVLESLHRQKTMVL